MSKIYGTPVVTPISPAIIGGGGGANGKSAYELAIEEGFEGTLTEWLESLEGKPGPAGPQGPEGPRGQDGQSGNDGRDGKDGKSGYEMVATDPNNDGNIVLEYRGEIPEGSIGGGLTAEEVQAMIDAALGGIENGTY